MWEMEVQGTYINLKAVLEVEKKRVKITKTIDVYRCVKIYTYVNIYRER